MHENASSEVWLLRARGLEKLVLLSHICSGESPDCVDHFGLFGGSLLTTLFLFDLLQISLLLLVGKREVVIVKSHLL